jgi:predicted dehydrogenase
MAPKIKIGVVGCGVVASAYYLPFIRTMENAELSAVCDTNPARTAACVRLFGATSAYQDYYDMLEKADLDAVFVLTGPGTHVPFTLAAVDRGKHILLQKPMSLDMAGANAIVAAVRKAGVKALIEPSSSTFLDPAHQALRELIQQGVLGTISWFSWMPGIPAQYHPALGGNPYGAGAFYAKDSGGMLLDFPYAPTQIATLLGSCRSVTGLAAITVPDRAIVPDSEYDRFLVEATDPDQANYWDVVSNLPKTQHVRMEAEDSSSSLYEMDESGMGVFHIARAFHPMPKDAGYGGLRVFGTEGNLVLGAGGQFASIISNRRELLPHTDSDGWYHIPPRGDLSKAQWPKPTPGAFHYYHESTRHLVECILADRDPLVNVEWGRHINEMLTGSIESARTGQRYQMTTTLTGMRGTIKT